MIRHIRLLLCGVAAAAAVVALASPAQAQHKFPAGPPAPPPPLFVNFLGPDGMKVTFYRGAMKATTLKAPCVVGLRPGYAYQVKVSDIPGHPQPLFPTLEVRGSIISHDGKLKPRNFPAALAFT